MSGKRITIRRGAGKSNTVASAEGVTAEEMSVFARVVNAATPSFAQASESLNAFTRAISAVSGGMSAPRTPPPAPPEGTVTGRMSSSSPNLSNVPRSDPSRMVVGVDPASGPDVTGSYLLSTGLGAASLSAASIHDSINMEAVSDTLAREISRRLAVTLEDDMLRGHTATARIRERGVPVIQVDYRYDTMVTEVVLQMWLNGPLQPHVLAGCTISDEEVHRAHLDSDSESSAAAHIRRIIVDRLNDALALEVRRAVERALDAAMSEDAGARRQMSRMFTMQSRRG